MQMTPCDACFFNTVFSWGSPIGGVYGNMVFKRDGSIAGYKHPNEASWRCTSPSRIELVSASGEVTSKLDYVAEGFWRGVKHETNFPLLLVSALSHDQGGSARPIIVNSIPKSGTYFLSKALSMCGFPESGLHLLDGNIVDDYRGLPIEEWHRSPEKCRLVLPIESVVAIAGGLTTVAHVSDDAVLNRLEAQGAFIFHLKRDLRDVVVSLYRFKKSRVAATNCADEAWRTLHEPFGFLSFLIHFSSEILSFCDFASLPSMQTAVRFEDIERGVLNGEYEENLDRLKLGLYDELCASLKCTAGVKTSTWSGGRSNWETYWSSEVEKVFVALGLRDANHILGY